jgi:hypothetical protein
MDYIDFKEKKQNILYQLQHSNDNIPSENSQALYDYYKYLHMFRHNYLHYLVLESLGQTWTEEKQIKDLFDIIVPEKYALKTPDIYHRHDNKHYLIDVSISVDIHKSLKQKEEKYKPISEWLTDNSIITQFIHLNIQSNYSNLLTEIEKIKNIMIKDFDQLCFFRAMSIIEDKKDWVNEKIDKEIFDELKTKEQVKQTDEDDYQGILFKENIRYENIGKYSDIDIDLKMFEEYNKNYTNVDEIIDCNNNFKESELITYLGNILETKNDIYKKYADESLTKTQFEEAHNTILKENLNYEMREPKPTHHLLIPFPDDIIPSTEEKREQTMLKEFMIEYLDNYVNIIYEDKKTDKLYFMRDLFEQTINALTISKDKDFNWRIFNNEKEDTSKTEYKLIKAKINLLNYYKKTKKLSSKLLLLINSKIDKTNLEDVSLLISNIEEEIQNYKDINNIESYRDYLRYTNKISDPDTETYIKDNKLIKISFKDFSEYSKRCYSKTGINKQLDETRKAPIESKKTISMENFVCVDDFLNYMKQSNKYTYDYKEYSYLIDQNNIGMDSEDALMFKKESVKNYSFYLELLTKTNAYNYSRSLHYCYQQLMHAVQLNTTPKSFYLFNSGISNLIVIVAMNYNSVKHDDGKSFMSIIKTKNPHLYTNLFGKKYEIKIKNTDYYYVFTNWRRLKLSKITFLRDVHYSVVSSTMNTIMSSPMVADYLINNKIEYIFSLRVLIGYATNQKIGELLVDTRYAFMSALSIYTSINKLLIEKFGPIYTTVLECWIIEKLMTRLPKIHNEAITNGILQTKIEMSHNVRDINTIGGLIKLSSLWGNYNMVDITELLDEAFVYVHTMKEPSSMYHENVKALKVIHNFQKEYDSLPYKIKKGLLCNSDDWDLFLKYPTKIGCSGPVIIASTLNNLNKEKPNYKKIINKINEESIGEVLSTKAVISDLEREVMEQQKPIKREIKKRLKRLLTHQDEKSTIIDAEKIKNYILTTKSKYYNKYKSRQKVMETILDVLIDHPELNTTVKFADYFIKTEKGKVLADICIKSQYGAKREFYVINIGAKTLARVCENFFKELCVNSPHEAISIAGDKKILSMQSMLDKIYYNNLTRDHKLMYVNGDCTKWSAAETMSSFLSMCIAMKEKITPKMYELLCSTFNSWGNKKIQIPMDIYNKVVPNQKYNTDFLKHDSNKNTATLDSTQNFLQGMFNYSSSYKAVCCINYTYYVWKKIYPNKNLIIEHMEHSDDYVLIVLYEDIKDFEKFRVLQKIMMRLHGYNDSERKTSCQPFLMEFVSQISFNGVMLYPQIKKSKEVNLCLPCTGYKTDMEAALSRVGECSRVGCNQSFLYFFQKWHCYMLADAYSILPKMENNFGRTYIELLNTPIELFGIPDMLPIFSLYCRGNGNNYRLYQYGDKNACDSIRFLYNKAQDTANEEDYLSEDIEYKYSLQSPRFMYEIQNKTIRKLRRNMDITNDDIQNFWKDHMSYKLLKPINIECLITWIKCMFFNRTFLEAYAKTTRTMMTMRLSRFVKTNIIKEIINIKDYTINLNKLVIESMTMKDYFHKQKNDMIFFLKNEKPENNKKTYYDSLQKIITKCDPTYSAIYSVLKQLSITYVKKEKTRTVQVAIKTPSKLKTINILNQPHLLLQYLYNNGDFILDKRKLISKDSLDKDILEIKDRISPEVLKSSNTMSLLSVYNDLMINKEKRIVMFGFNRHCNLLIDAITESFSYNFLPGYILQINYKNIITIKDPINNQLLYTKGLRLTVDSFRQSIDNICLVYVYLRHYCNLKTIDLLNIIFDLKFKIQTDENDYQTMDSKTILKKITPNYIKSFNYNLEDRKIIGYMKSVILGEYDVLDDLTNSIYTFTYKYIVSDTQLGGEYKGYTEVQYTYFNTTCKAIYDPNYCSTPLMIINKYYPGLEAVHYNIALKLTTGIPDHEFEKTISISRIKLLTYEQLLKLKPLLQKMKINYIVKKYEQINQIIKIQDANENSVYLPIFLTKEIMYRGGDRSLNLAKARPNCVEGNMSVYLGKSKLYTLPFWKCTQYDNTYLEKDVFVDYVSLNSLFIGRRLEKFVKGKLNKHNDILDIQTDKDWGEFNFVMEQIKKHKIYDIDYTKLLNPIENNLLREALFCTPELDKTYEVNFLKTENIFIINKNIDYDSVFSLNNNKDKEMQSIPDLEPVYNVETDDFFDLNIENKNENIEDVLMIAAQNMVFDETFTDMIIEESDLGKYGNAILEGQDYDFGEDYFGKGQYLTEEMLTIKGVEVKLSDIFVNKPEKKIKNKKEGAGYILTQLKNEESIYIQNSFFKKSVEKTNSYLSLGNYIYNLKYIINIINKKLQNNDMVLNSALIFLYKILCKTFILTKVNDLDNKTFKIIDRTITTCLKIENNYNNDKIRILIEKNLILDQYIALDKNYLIIKCNETIFEKQYDKDINSGIDNKKLIFLSEEINKELTNYYVNNNRNPQILEELLNQ